MVDLLNAPPALGVEGADLAGDAHAGVVETSLMLHLGEHLVKSALLEELPPQPVEFAEMGRAASFRELGNGLGYTGVSSGPVRSSVGESSTTTRSVSVSWYYGTWAARM